MAEYDIRVMGPTRSGCGCEAHAGEGNRTYSEKSESLPSYLSNPEQHRGETKNQYSMMPQRVESTYLSEPLIKSPAVPGRFIQDQSYR